MHALESQNDPIYQNLREIGTHVVPNQSRNSEYKACSKNVNSHTSWGTLCSRFD